MPAERVDSGRLPAEPPATDVAGGGPAADAAGPLTVRRLSRRYVPRHVSACHHSLWSVVTWPTTGSGATEHGLRCSPYVCRSWRHPGECQRKSCATTYRRIREAMAARDDSGFVYSVLTFDRSMHYTECYKEILAAWDKFRKRVQRKFGKFEYVLLIEQHRDRWPHVNVLVHSAALAQACDGEGWRAVAREFWRPAARASGFGRIHWLEPMKCADGLAGYFGKIARGEAERLTGEFAKDSQIPVYAPARFRRLRASRGFLPPEFRGDGSRTGALVGLDPVGTREAIMASYARGRESFPILANCRDAGVKKVWLEIQKWTRENLGMPRITIEMPCDLPAERQYWESLESMEIAEAFEQWRRREPLALRS